MHGKFTRLTQTLGTKFNWALDRDALQMPLGLLSICYTSCAIITSWTICECLFAHDEESWNWPGTSVMPPVASVAKSFCCPHDWVLHSKQFQHDASSPKYSRKCPLLIFCNKNVSMGDYLHIFLGRSHCCKRTGHSKGPWVICLTIVYRHIKQTETTPTTDYIILDWQYSKSGME